MTASGPPRGGGGGFRRCESVELFRRARENIMPSLRAGTLQNGNVLFGRYALTISGDFDRLLFVGIFPRQSLEKFMQMTFEFIDDVGARVKVVADDDDDNYTVRLYGDGREGKEVELESDIYNPTLRDTLIWVGDFTKKVARAIGD